VIKGKLSCGEDLYIDGQVDGTIDPKGNRLTIGPHGRVRANVNACAVVVHGKLEVSIQSQRPGRPKAVGRCHGGYRGPAISIDEGACFKGGVNIQREVPKKEVPRAAAS